MMGRNRTRASVHSGLRRAVRFFPWLLVLALVGGDTRAEEFAADLRARFKPTEPTIALTYRVSYRIMDIEITQIAVARIGVTIGLWEGAEGGPPHPATLVDFALDTLEERESDRQRNIHVVLHNKVLSVLRRPELDAVVFAKRTDQSLRFLWNRKQADNLERYDLESGELRYHRIDYLTGTETTNLVGHLELAREGKEVCRLLRLAHEAYVQEVSRGQVLTKDVPVHLYIQGDLVPYAIKVRQKNATIRLIGHAFRTLRLWAYPLRKASGPAYGCEAWILSFRDLAAQVEPRCLDAFGEDVAEWLMVPLIAEFDLPLGRVRGLLTTIAGFDDRGTDMRDGSEAGAPMSVPEQRDLDKEIMSTYSTLE